MRWLAVVFVVGCGTAGAEPDEPWLKGSTHVHAAPSGDSSEPVADVIRWYDDHDYDFIALTDHNRVTRAPDDTGGVIVLPGVELTYNPKPKWRIHVNVLAPTARPRGKIAWADRDSTTRVDAYQPALDLARAWAGWAQINHPQWHWGMTGELLTELAARGARFVEIANQAFRKWNDGDDDHPSVEALWDDALTAGHTMWGIASDDAHHYDGDGKYPAGTGWVMVRAARDADAIVAALVAGRFYASTGVVLDRAEAGGDRLVVEVADASAGEHEIECIGDGEVLATHAGRRASHALDAASYVRAVVRRDDGARAWVQPHRR